MFIIVKYQVSHYIPDEGVLEIDHSAFEGCLSLLSVKGLPAFEEGFLKAEGNIRVCPPS